MLMPLTPQTACLLRAALQCNAELSPDELAGQKCDEHVKRPQNTNTVRMACSRGGSRALGAANVNSPGLHIIVRASGPL